jgi:hypothetical protein
VNKSAGKSVARSAAVWLAALGAGTPPPPHHPTTAPVPVPYTVLAVCACAVGKVRDPKAAVTEHFHGIVEELLRAMSCEQWRERRAGCAGMTDVLMGRSFAEVRAARVPCLGSAWVAGPAQLSWAVRAFVCHRWRPWLTVAVPALRCVCG